VLGGHKLIPANLAVQAPAFVPVGYHAVYPHPEALHAAKVPHNRRWIVRIRPSNRNHRKSVGVPAFVAFDLAGHGKLIPVAPARRQANRLCNPLLSFVQLS